MDDRDLIISCTLNTFPSSSLLQKFDNIIFTSLFYGLVIILYFIQHIYSSSWPSQEQSIINNILWWLLISRVYNIHQNIHVEGAKASIRPPM